MLPLKDYSLNECGANVAVSFTADTSMPWSDLVHHFVVDVCGAFDRKLERKRESCDRGFGSDRGLWEVHD